MAILDAFAAKAGAAIQVALTKTLAAATPPRMIRRFFTTRSFPDWAGALPTETHGRTLSVITRLLFESKPLTCDNLVYAGVKGTFPTPATVLLANRCASRAAARWPYGVNEDELMERGHEGWHRLTRGDRLAPAATNLITARSRRQHSFGQEPDQLTVKPLNSRKGTGQDWRSAGHHGATSVFGGGHHQKLERWERS
jgi:hypothetical protein